MTPRLRPPRRGAGGAGAFGGARLRAAVLSPGRAARQRPEHPRHLGRWEGDFSDLTSFFHHGAHPMWHVLVALVMLAGVPLAPAAAGVTALLKAAEVWLIYRLLDRRLGGRMRPEAVAALAFALGMAASLLTPPQPRRLRRGRLAQHLAQPHPAHRHGLDAAVRALYRPLLRPLRRPRHPPSPGARARRWA